LGCDHINALYKFTITYLLTYFYLEQIQRSCRSSHLIVCLSFYILRSDMNVFVVLIPLVIRDPVSVSFAVRHILQTRYHACKPTLNFLQKFLILNGDSILRCRTPSVAVPMTCTVVLKCPLIYKQSIYLLMTSSILFALGLL